MKVTSRNHIHNYVPDFMDNRKLPKARSSEQIVVRMRVITTPDNDAFRREKMENERSFAPDLAQEKNEARLMALYREKFVGIDNLEIEGLEGKDLDFDTFYAEAPPEMVSEIIWAMKTKDALTAGEQKNFLPE